MDKLTAQVSALATSTAATVTSFPHDVLVIAGLFVFFGASAFFLGKGKIIAFILALYIASLLYTFFPMVDIIERFKVPLSLASGVIFSALLILALLALRRVFRLEYAYGEITVAIEVLLLSASSTVLTIVLSQNVIPLTYVYQFSPTISLYLNQPYIFFFSLLAPLLIIFLISTRKRYD